MNFKLNFGRGLLLIVALGCIMFAGPAQARHEGQGQLIVQRAANFGTYVTLQMSIDGIEVAQVSRGRRYNRLIPAGPHVLTVTSVPNVRNATPTSTVLRVRPGQTYVFTADWDEYWGTIVLLPSTLAL
jgi:hypothetical protein